jgi:hypothetical protein
VLTSDSRIVDRYEKLLIFRMVQVADTIIADAPEIAYRTGFREAWSNFETWPGGILARAAKLPAVDAWVRTAERLVAAGAHKRYPHAHTSRHLKDFARIELCLACDAPDGMTGRVQMLGRRSLLLNHGRLSLTTQVPTVSTLLEWSVKNNRLLLSVGEGAVVELDLSASIEAVVPSSSWALHVVPTVRGILVDGRTHEYGGCQDDPSAASGICDAIARALDSLSSEDRTVVDTFCRCITVSSGDRRSWTAGLLSLASDEDIGAASILQRAHRDRLERLMTTTMPSMLAAAPASPASDFRSVVADLGARRLVRDGDSQSGEEESRWEGVVSQLAKSVEGRAFLHATGMDATAAADGSSDNRAPSLFLHELIAEAGIVDPLMTGWALQKTRRGSRSELDWSAMNALIRRKPSEIDSLKQLSTRREPQSEETAFCSAVSAYLLGEWEACTDSVFKCLSCDPDVEEYWYLAAFAARHAGKEEVFARIMFQSDRSIDGATSP